MISIAREYDRWEEQIYPTGTELTADGPACWCVRHHDSRVIVLMTVLATGIDGTSQASLSIPCPDVSPYSKIYFLQL